MEPLTPPLSPDRLGGGDLEIPEEVYDILLSCLPTRALSAMSLTGYSVYKKMSKITSNVYYWIKKLSDILDVDVDPRALGSTDAKALCVDLEKVDKSAAYILSIFGKLLTSKDTTERALNAALISSSRNGMVTLAKFLLDKGADPNASEGAPLRHAVVGKQPSTVDLLLSYDRIKIDPSLIQLAIKYDTSIARKIILDGRVNYDRYTDMIRQWAARNGYDDVMSILNSRELSVRESD